MFKLVVQLVIRKYQWIKNFCRKLKHVEIHILVFAKIKIFSTISSALENYGSRIVPGKKYILSGGRHLLCSGRHLIYLAAATYYVAAAT